jgi:hypothetical protein
MVFMPGTGDGAPPMMMMPGVPMRPMLACAALPQLQAMLAAPAELSAAQSPYRIDPQLLDQALASYARHECSFGRIVGPAIIVIVDFAKRSKDPRLYRIDLRNGDGAETPIRVAHGIGSDPNDDGIADSFGNVQNSLMSSLGASRGAEIYVGINGLSLRLDGLDPSNSEMRARDIVVHSYGPTMLRYFNGEHVLARGGRPGTSEGCFVVEPDKRDWILQTLAHGGFLYAGYGGMLPVPKPLYPGTGQTVMFMPGTGTNPIAPAVPVLETPAGTSGSPPTAPISPATATAQQ